MTRVKLLHKIYNQLACSFSGTVYVGLEMGTTMPDHSLSVIKKQTVYGVKRTERPDDMSAPAGLSTMS